jgi:predicted N-formylglutamate amidohydrolase
LSTASEIVAGPVVRAENISGSGPFVFLCDHASNRVPAEFDGLGLAPDHLCAHIAWDPGALELTRALAVLCDGPLIHPTVSRLVIDCNRPEDARDLIVEESDSISIPVNVGLSRAQRADRIARFHEPFHAAISACVCDRRQRGRTSALVAVHSFTPIFKGTRRPWPIGILFDRDRRLADPLIDQLREAGIDVGVNQPYGPSDRVYTTLTQHGDDHGLASVMIELRNDEIADGRSQEIWAQRIFGILQTASVA